MQASAATPQKAPDSVAQSPKEPVTIYHWLVFALAAAGWLFDCMGQRIFVLSREPALRELLGAAASDEQVRRWGGMATLLLMVGWATGGILFGFVTDRLGRSRTLLVTMLTYATATAACAFAPNVWTLAAFGSIAPDTTGPPLNHASTPSHSAALLYAVMRWISGASPSGFPGVRLG